jgi:DNA-binding transcriptional LysR family regulator
MELRQLHTFTAVAEQLSFTRAAEALSYAQSSVTAQIQALEAELGVPLFERLGRRVVLTEAGVRLRGYAARLIQLEAEARLAVPSATEPAGTLQIGAPESLCTYRLPPVLARFRERFPRVKLVFRPGNCTDLMRRVADGSLDVVFVLDEETSHPGVRSTPLRREPIRVLARPDHPLASRRGVTSQDLAGETILHTEADCAYRLMFDRALAESGVRPDVAVEFSSLEAIKQAAIAGMGLAVLPEVSVEAEIAMGRLAALDWRPDDFAVLTQVTWHKDKWLSPALTAFLTLVGETFETPMTLDPDPVVI